MKLNKELTNVSANNMEVNTDSDLGLMKTLMEASTNLERTSEEVFEGSGLFQIAMAKLMTGLYNPHN